MVQCNRKFFLLVLFIAMVTIVYLYCNINTNKEPEIWQDKSKNKKLKNSYKRINFNKDKDDVFSFVHIQKTGGTTFEKHLIRDIKNSNCECKTSKKPSCMCYRKNTHDIWLVCRYVQPKWPCGLHPDLETLKECTPTFVDSINKHNTKKTRYFYGTVLRDPILRFLSEFRHMQRGASWEAAASLCRGQLLMNQIPSCYDEKMWENLTIEKFISCPYNLAINRQTWMLSNISNIGCDFKNVLSSPENRKKLLAMAKRNLKSIAYFGILEYPNESQYIFEKTFDLEFKEPFELVDTGFAQEYLKSYNQTDDMLHKIRTLNSLDFKLYEFAKSIFFERYHYFVEKYGEPKFDMVRRKIKEPINKEKLERIKNNLPKSKRKEKMLRKRRERSQGEKQII